MMIMQLSVKEIDQIISFLQEPYPYELIKRLEQLKAETELHLNFSRLKAKDSCFIAPLMRSLHKLLRPTFRRPFQGSRY